MRIKNLKPNLENLANKLSREEIKHGSFSKAHLTVVAIIFASIGGYLVYSSFAAEPFAGSITKYVDPLQDPNKQGVYSHWLNNWRSYLETRPGTEMVNSLGVNFTPTTVAAENDTLAQVMSDNGFKNARVEFGWNSIDYRDDSKILIRHAYAQGEMDGRLNALAKYHLRPLVLLNLNSGDPAPSYPFDATIISAANKSEYVLNIQIPPTVNYGYPAAPLNVQIVPHKTGIKSAPVNTPTYFDNYLNSSMVESVKNLGNNQYQVTMSKPLYKDFIAGDKLTFTTFKYAPFTDPVLANGSPSPLFEETVNGWLQYAGTIGKEFKQRFGTNFDMEIYNELSFGANFLWNTYYYGKVPQLVPGCTDRVPTCYAKDSAGNVIMIDDPLRPGYGGSGDHVIAIRERTAKYLKDPNLGLSGVRITDGFASQTLKYMAGKTADPRVDSWVEPLEIDAMSKHFYGGGEAFYPGAATASSWMPLGADGLPVISNNPRSGSDDPKQPIFTPKYYLNMPEFSLTSIHNDGSGAFLTDIKPNPTKSGHGRFTRSNGTELRLWETEWSYGPKAVSRTGDSAYTEATDPAYKYAQAKAFLRRTVAGVNKGIEKQYYFQMGNDRFRDYALLSWDFLDAEKAAGYTNPGSDKAGPIVTSLGRLEKGFADSQTLTSTRQLSLDRIDDYAGNKQFDGDPNVFANFRPVSGRNYFPTSSTDTPTKGVNYYPELDPDRCDQDPVTKKYTCKKDDPKISRPTLYNRDVLAFLPFQTKDNKFVIPTYIMTRNAMTLYDPSKPKDDVTRWDLPDEKYRLTIGGVNSTSANIYATDPLLNKTIPVSVISRAANQVVVELSLTDSPRLLTIEEASSTTPPPAPTPSPTPTPTPPPTTPKPGDINNDNSVNITDLSYLLSSYGQNTTQCITNTSYECDLSSPSDNTVSIFDLSILLSKYGS